MAKKKPATKRAARATKKPAKPRNSEEDARTIAALEARIVEIKGGKLNAQQTRDRDWLAKQERAATIAAWIEKMPKGEYCRLASRQHKLVDDAARQYELPIGGPTINLIEAITALHNLIADNAHRLRKDLDKNRADLEIEKLQQQIIGITRDNEKKDIELMYSKGKAIPKVKVGEALEWLSGRLQMLGSTLNNIHPDARECLAEYLESLAEECESGSLKF